MKISLSRQQKSKGFLIPKTVYVVSLQVTLDNEERAIITSRNLSRYTFAMQPWYTTISDALELARSGSERMLGGILIPMWVGDLLKSKPIETTFPDLPKAIEFEAELKDSLKNLKKFIDNASGPTDSKDEFEL